MAMHDSPERSVILPGLLRKEYDALIISSGPVVKIQEVGNMDERVFLAYLFVK